MMKVVSLFSGCGGTDLGFKLAGHEIVFANDFDAIACKTYSKNFPETKIVCEDIKKVTNFPKADILVGCYPCQGFSLAGKRNPNDDRNMLYLDFARALRQVKPKFFVAENVKGMLTIAKSTIFKNMLKLFRQCGYKVKYNPDKYDNRMVRDYIWNHQDELMGKIVKVRYTDENVNEKGELDLRLCRLIEFRDDKSEPSYN